MTILDTFLLSSHNHPLLLSSLHRYATLSVHADGVHVLDLSSLHPVLSHSLGPTTAFPCPAVSKHTSENGDHICTTYAAIRAPDQTCSVRLWRENVSASLDVSQKKTLDAKQSQDVAALYVPHSDPTLVLLSSNARLTILDGENLSVKASREPPDETASLIKSFFFPPNSPLFRPAVSTGTLVVLVLRVGAATRVQVLVVEGDAVTELGTCEIKVNPEQLCGVSCSPSGHMSALTRDGTWQSFQLEHTSNAIQTSPVSDPLHLASLSFISSTPRRTHDEVSLLALSSSHVLLAGITTTHATPEIALLLWDLQYSVLLAAHTMPVPSSLTPDAKDTTTTGIKLDLVAASASQALLALSPARYSPDHHHETHSETPTSASSSSEKRRSSVLVVPLVVPPTSTLANAMGRAGDGAAWLARSHHTPAPATSAADHGNDSGHEHEQLFQAMRAALDRNDGKAASEAFFKWEQGEMARIKAAGKTKDVDSRVVLEYEFVKRVLGIVLRASDKATNVTRTSSEVLRHLLSKSAVSSGMVEGGLLPALLLRNDWTSIELAFSHVRDIPEGDVVSVVRHVVRRALDSDGDAAMMQVDDEDEDEDGNDRADADAVPSVQRCLSWCVGYRTTPGAMRLAVHRYLRGADELVCVLGVVEGWMAAWSGGADVLSSSSLSSEKKKKKSKETTGEVPPMIKVLGFLQVLLDASLVTLVQHTPAHAVLRRVQAHLEPEIAEAEAMERLRGPLEPFARRVRVGKRSSAASSSASRARGARKKEEQEQVGLAVGLYRLEQLVL